MATCLQRVRCGALLLLASMVDFLRQPGRRASLAAGSPLQPRWYSQYGQDQLIYERFFSVEAAKAAVNPPPESLSHQSRMKRGIFIELGAADGVDKSNTLVFEQQLGWTGLLIEPSNELFPRLKQSRPHSICLHTCVARKAGYYEFQEDGYSSGFTAYQGYDTAGGDKRYCETLPDLIDKHLGKNARINYLSLDMEGGELDILQTFDFARHPVDVISVEVHEFRDQSRLRAMQKIFKQNHFQFVERIVQDDIYVRRRGVSPDPSCLLPSVQLWNDVNSGWASTRASLWRLLRVMQDSADMAPSMIWNLLYRDAILNSSVSTVMAMQEDENADHWEDQCPLGVLSVTAVANLLTNRKTSQPLEGTGVAEELRGHTAFHSTTRLKIFADAHAGAFEETVGASELRGEKFDLKFPLGRAWHETSFIDALESGWPIFGILDLMARLTNRSGNIFKKIKMMGVEYYFPLEVPRMPCKLQTRRGGRKANLEVRSGFDSMSIGKVKLLYKDKVMKLESLANLQPMLNTEMRGSHHVSTSRLALDVDSCSFLGIAAARFHMARAKVRSLLSRSGWNAGERYVPLANWTAACHQPWPTGRRQCAEGCAAVGSRRSSAVRPVPKQCLRIRPSPGSWVRVRRRKTLLDQQVSLWIVEGERLLREFMNRHGLYATIYASAQPQLAPAAHGGAGHAGSAQGVFGSGERESLFAVLQSLQELLLESEGLRLG